MGLAHAHLNEQTHLIWYISILTAGSHNIYYNLLRKGYKATPKPADLQVPQTVDSTLLSMPKRLWLLHSTYSSI